MVKLFEELFVEPRTWKFKSSSSDKEYTVTEGKWLFCDCWGYIAHKRCKHIKKVKERGIKLSLYVPIHSSTECFYSKYLFNELVTSPSQFQPKNLY